MRSILCTLLGSLSSQWGQQQQQQPDQQEEHREEHREDTVQAELRTEAAAGSEGNTQGSSTTPVNETKKTKTVTIKTPPEETRHRKPTDDIMRCIDQIADGELTRAEL